MGYDRGYQRDATRLRRSRIQSDSHNCRGGQSTKRSRLQEIFKKMNGTRRGQFSPSSEEIREFNRTAERFLNMLKESAQTARSFVVLVLRSRRKTK